MLTLKMSLPILLLVLVSTLVSTTVLAEACTYREAMMALEQGNAVRGIALMRMASRDGDKRAVHFLAVKDFHFKEWASPTSRPQKSVVSFNKH